jgi:hypothetical protein
MRPLRFLALLSASACVNFNPFGGTGPLPPNAVGTWHLRTISGAPLPARLAEVFDTVTFLSSVLTLSADGSFSEVASVQLQSAGRNGSLTESGKWEGGFVPPELLFFDISTFPQNVFLGLAPESNSDGTLDGDTLKKTKYGANFAYTR